MPAPRTTVEAERLSDEATIRNAVTSADIETLAGAPLPWANAETGARGQVTGIVETKGKGTLCRSFSATRESFDGVGMYKGEACMVASGAWRMQSFEALCKRVPHLDVRCCASALEFLPRRAHITGD